MYVDIEGARYSFPEAGIQGESGSRYYPAWNVAGPILGRGGNSIILPVAKSRQQRPQFAAKILKRLDDSKRRRFKFECHLQKDRLDHSGICRIYDVGQFVDNIPFAIMPLARGNLYADIEENGAWAPKRCLKTYRQLLETFQYIHGERILHRDIKPANLLLMEGGVVVSDFGLAKTTDDQGQDRFYSGLTVAGEQVLAALWYSPELLEYSKNKAHPVSERSDMFQLGKVFWFMLTSQNATGQIARRRDPTGGKLYDVIAALLMHEPEDRPRNVEEVQAQLASIVV